MEKDSLIAALDKLKNSPDLNSKRDVLEPWYNEYGDCIEFQTVNEAIVADRIDDFLTIFRSAKSNEPIGFQLKDIKALAQKYHYDKLKVEIAIKGNKILSLTALLISALAERPSTIKRRNSYSEAIRNITQTGKDAVALTV